jgi:hypothetical protein
MRVRESLKPDRREAGASASSTRSSARSRSTLARQEARGAERPSPLARHLHTKRTDPDSTVCTRSTSLRAHNHDQPDLLTPASDRPGAPSAMRAAIPRTPPRLASEPRRWRLGLPALRLQGAARRADRVWVRLTETRLNSRLRGRILAIWARVPLGGSLSCSRNEPCGCCAGWMRWRRQQPAAIRATRTVAMGGHLFGQLRVRFLSRRAGPREGSRRMFPRSRMSVRP